ncbi:TIGR03619 family F420-dependent LLM class oxidoreductase [Nocardia brasiliensis]|uniref:TIGR03619 family F420-dependent LLM class oxidoreductase n=1 Tax=Nocardia brasiliensis TaxID=37326 RepID=UPI002455DBA7|nr:TIGR03619 family F420-dependent LLM class oxidoreductase [Nocardia brasiliensis]
MADRQKAVAMQFGVSIPNYGAAVSGERLAEWGSGCERLGFDLAMVTDHLAQPADVRRAYPEDFYESFAALTYLAALTRTIKVGTSVAVLPLRHPLHTARAIATIDQLSGGRVVFGIGVGGAELEYRALGVDFRRRGAIADEYLSVITQLWRGEITGFAGEFVTFDDVLATPSPAQRGGPPIWVGGSAAPALRRAVDHDGVWHPTFPTLASLDSGMRTANALAAERGTRPPGIAPRIRLAIQAEPAPEPDRPLGVGSIDQIATDLRDLADRAITAVVFDPVHHPFMPNAPESRTVAEDNRAWDAIEQLAAEIIDTRAHSLR